MNPADLLILLVLSASVISAFIKGFFVEVFSLIGVVAGLFLAAGNYQVAAPWIARFGLGAEVANLVAFVLIALGVSLLAALAGRLIRSLLRQVGLGIADRLLGAVFGLIQGCVIVTVILMGLVAFLPRQDWLNGSRLAPAFLAAAHGSSHVVPFALGEKIREGLQALRTAHPGWLLADPAIHWQTAGLLLGARYQKPGTQAGRKKKEVFSET